MEMLERNALVTYLMRLSHCVVIQFALDHVWYSFFLSYPVRRNKVLRDPCFNGVASVSVIVACHMTALPQRGLLRTNDGAKNSEPFLLDQTLAGLMVIAK